MNNLGRNLFIWALVALIVIVLFSQFQHSGTNTPTDKVGFSQFLDNVNAGNVEAVTIQGNEIQNQKVSRNVALGNRQPRDAEPMRNASSNHCMAGTKPR